MHVLEDYGLSEKQILAATGLSKSFLDEPFYTYGDMFILLDYGHSIAGGQYAVDICHYLWPTVLGPLGRRYPRTRYRHCLYVAAVALQADRSLQHLRANA